MALEPGGYSEKLGNRYEGRWVAKQLLLLLGERIRAVTLESVGDDEAGVDLWIESNDGVRNAHQCKTENGIKPFWTLSDLRQRGVLAHLREQLSRDTDIRFTFVSGSPATELRDLTRSARDSTGVPESFYKHQIQAGSRTRRDSFSTWCRCLSLDDKNEADREIAFDWLRRSDFHHFSADRNELDTLRFLAQFSVVGNPEAVLASLANFAQEHLRKKIIANDLWRYLTESGFHPRMLSADERLMPRIRELQEEFKESVRPHLAGNRLIHRKEVGTLLQLLGTLELPDVIVLHGKAGHGKTGVLYQLVLELEKQQIAYLPIRLDRKKPQGSPRQFGIDLGLLESPLNCLDAIAANQPAVLILDQLDALRWTSSHSADSIDICKSIIREALTLREFGRPISVILCCRTYDLDHDPQISKWLVPSSRVLIHKTEVAALKESVVREFVESFSVDFDRMTPHRRSLLESIHNLSIWAEVVTSGDPSPDFDSGTDLMRQFWSNRRRELEKVGFSPNDRDALLEIIVNHMERSATLACPWHLVESYEGLLTELQTLNVLHGNRRSVSFCHQSYLDFLIANRAFKQIESLGSGVSEWLGDLCRQSLFRREQLRQLLFLLADEKPGELSIVLDSIFGSSEIRFHLKQLTLEAIAQMHPTSALMDRVIQMVGDSTWSVHVLSNALYGNVEWVLALRDVGTLFEWLSSNDSTVRGRAIYLIQSVLDRTPQLLSDALNAVDRAGVTRDILKSGLMFTKPECEPDDVFEYRLNSFNLNEKDFYANWKELSSQRPDRTLRLLRACLLAIADKKNGLRRIREEIGLHSNDFLTAVISTGERCPKKALNLLLPILVKIVRKKLVEKRDWNRRESSVEIVPWPSTHIPKILLLVLTSAVCALARKSPRDFLRLEERLGPLRSRTVQYLLLRGWLVLDVSFADAAVMWLLGDPNRSRCGSEASSPRWSAPAKLIRRFSSDCSDEVFQYLEERLLKFRDPDEKRYGPYWIRDTRDGRFDNQFLAAQHFLLPGLDPHRRMTATTGMIGVLDRKFAAFSHENFLRTRPKGGWVRSPLKHDKLLRISDVQWLRLINNRRIGKREAHRNSKYFKNFVVQSSVEMFARDFGTAAKQEPERFCRLGLHFSDDTPSDYLSELLRALSQSRPPDQLPKELVGAWRPASSESIEQLLDRMHLTEDSDVCRTFCWLLGDRKDLQLSDKVAATLSGLTRHPDPLPDHLRINHRQDPADVDMQDLAQNAINCVRSLAPITIGRMLYAHPELFPRFKTELESLIGDPHPVVRLAMVEAVLPIWNIDRALCVDWFLKIVADDFRLACDRHSRELLNHAFPTFSVELTPLIHSMCVSSKDEVVIEGAAESTARFLLFDLFGDLTAECLDGIESQRKGVASVVGHYIRDAKYSTKCEPMFVKLCGDTSKDVRDLATRSLYHSEIFEIENNQKVLRAYLASRAFEDDPDRLSYAIEESTGSLIPYSDFIFGYIETLVRMVRDPTRSDLPRMPLIDSRLNKILLRLYEQSHDVSENKIACRCLDMFDHLLESRLLTPQAISDGLRS